MQVQTWLNTVGKTVGYWSRRTAVQVTDSVADVKSWNEGLSLSVVRVKIVLRDTLTSFGNWGG